MSPFDIPEIPSKVPLMGSFISMLQDSTREWQDELGSVPIEGIVWQPFPMGYSIGGQLLHIISVEKGWIHERCGGIPFSEADSKLLMRNETNVDDAIWPTPPNEPLDWYYDIFSRVRSTSLEVMANITDPERIHKSTWSHHEFTVRWMIAHTIEHDSYHGGQAVMLKTLWEKMGHP